MTFGILFKIICHRKENLPSIKQSCCVNKRPHGYFSMRPFFVLRVIISFLTELPKVFYKDIVIVKA